MWLLLVRLLVRLVHHGESGDRPSGNQNWLPPSPYSIRYSTGHFFIWHIKAQFLTACCCLYGGRSEQHEERAY
jgi:hypothetical protein